MAVTIAVVTENVGMSRRWKAEKVAYGIRIQPLPILSSLMPLNLINPLTYPFYPEPFSTVFSL
jgi:hypothetical protein